MAFFIRLMIGLGGTGLLILACWPAFLTVIIASAWFDHLRNARLESVSLSIGTVSVSLGQYLAIVAGLTTALAGLGAVCLRVAFARKTDRL